LIASGPGAASRFSMGVVIASGMTIGTLFTLFVLPAFYLYLARDHAHDRDHENALDHDGGDGRPPEPVVGH
jgi:multidrug efflux pump